MYLTWYGVQTNGVVVPDQYEYNAAKIVNYFVQSPMNYTGIMLHLDSPTGVDVHGGKPPNFAAYPQLLAEIVAAIPLKYRVGVHAVLEADAVWRIAPATILDRSGSVRLPVSDSTATPALDPTQFGNPKLGFKDNKWYGGAGSETDKALAAYSTLFKGWGTDPATADPSTGGCPYSILKSGTPDEWPSGCPGNASRLAWYLCLVNAILRSMNSLQRVTMVNCDAEFAGPTPITCLAYQFVQGLQEFGTPEDVLPLVGGTSRMPWKILLNGSSDLTPEVAYPPKCAGTKCTPCGEWFEQPLADPVKVDGKIVATKYGEVAIVDAAGEWYWFKGEDLGNNMYEPRYGMAPALWDMGFEGCPQSSPGKDLYDNKCGCRQTVYEKLKNQPRVFLNAMKPVYDPRAYLVPKTTPTFSIEHLGSAANTVSFGNCINSVNFCPTTRVSGGDNDSKPNWSCAADVKCKVRCGVMNAFGVWQELKLRDFLYAFAAKYKARSLMVYDAGFVPLSWVPTQTSDVLKGTSLGAVLSKPNPFDVSDCSTTPTPPGPCSADKATAASPYCTLSCPLPVPQANRSTATAVTP
jgi:hypothetical protein